MSVMRPKALPLTVQTQDKQKLRLHINHLLPL